MSLTLHLFCSSKSKMAGTIMCETPLTPAECKKHDHHIRYVRKQIFKNSVPEWVTLKDGA